MSFIAVEPFLVPRWAWLEGPGNSIPFGVLIS